MGYSCDRRDRKRGDSNAVDIDDCSTKVEATATVPSGENGESDGSDGGTGIGGGIGRNIGRDDGFIVVGMLEGSWPDVKFHNGEDSGIRNRMQ